MRKDIVKAREYEALSALLRNADLLAPGIIQISFKGYTAEDLDCKYCLHYGGKSKGCRIAKCCCEEEKQQAAITTTTNL